MNWKWTEPQPRNLSILKTVNSYGIMSSEQIYAVIDGSPQYLMRCPDFFGHKIGKVKQGFMCYIMNSDSFVTNIVTQTQLVSCNPAMNESAHDYKKHQENNTDLYRHHGNQHIPLPILIRPSDDL